MTEVESIGLEHLRDIRGAIDGMREDIREIRQRLGLLENHYASMSNRMDRMDGRIERRLELTEV